MSRKPAKHTPPPPLTKQAELAAYQQAQTDFESEAAETHKGFCHYFTARQGIEFDSLPALYQMYLEACGPLHFWFTEGNRRQRVEVLKYVIETLKT